MSDIVPWIVDCILSDYLVLFCIAYIELNIMDRKPFRPKSN